MDHYFAPSHTFLDISILYNHFRFFKNVAKFMEAYCTLRVDLRLNACFLTSNQTVFPLGNGQPGYCRIWQYSVFKETPIDLWTSLVAQLVKNLPAMWETRVWSLDWEHPLEKENAMHSSILAWRIPWTSPWGRKESDVTERISLSFPSVSSLKHLSYVNFLKYMSTSIILLK